MLFFIRHRYSLGAVASEQGEQDAGHANCDAGAAAFCFIAVIAGVVADWHRLLVVSVARPPCSVVGGDAGVAIILLFFVKSCHQAVAVLLRRR